MWLRFKLMVLIAFSLFNNCCDNGKTNNKIVLVFSASVKGNLVDCGCGEPLGGLARNAALVKNLREKYCGALIRLDVGGFMAVSGTDRVIRNAALLRAYESMSFDAINIATLDLSPEAGDTLSKAINEGSLPLISSNILDGSSLLMPPYKIVKRGGYTVGIIGLTRTNFKAWDSKLYQLRVVDPISRVSSLIKELRGNVDLLIILAWYPRHRIEDLTSAFPEVDFIVASDGITTTDEPIMTDGPVVIYPGVQGKYLALLGIGADTEESWKFELVPLHQDLPEDKSIKQIVDSALVESYELGRDGKE